MIGYFSGIVFSIGLQKPKYRIHVSYAVYFKLNYLCCNLYDGNLKGHSMVYKGSSQTPKLRKRLKGKRGGGLSKFYLMGIVESWKWAQFFN